MGGCLPSRPTWSSSASKYSDPTSSTSRRRSSSWGPCHGQHSHQWRGRFYLIFSTFIFFLILFAGCILIGLSCSYLLLRPAPPPLSEAVNTSSSRCHMIMARCNKPSPTAPRNINFFDSGKANTLSCLLRCFDFYLVCSGGAPIHVVWR